SAAARPCRQPRGYLATVSRNATSSSAFTLCLALGTTSRSPAEPFHSSTPLISVNVPDSTWMVASPPLSCSARLWPAVRATTVWRRVWVWPPYTVCELRPLEAVAASLSCWRARAVSDFLSMGVPFAGSAFRGECLSRSCGALPPPPGRDGDGA